MLHLILNCVNFRDNSFIFLESIEPRPSKDELATLIRSLTKAARLSNQTAVLEENESESDGGEQELVPSLPAEEAPLVQGAGVRESLRADERND